MTNTYYFDIACTVLKKMDKKNGLKKMNEKKWNIKRVKKFCKENKKKS